MLFFPFKHSFWTRHPAIRSNESGQTATLLKHEWDPIPLGLVAGRRI
jgi:hypothetical protein